MIIDLILDRQDGAEYSPKKFYEAVMGYGPVGDGIADAMDNGSELDVKRALRIYVVSNDYRNSITDFIDSVNWL